MRLLLILSCLLVAAPALAQAPAGVPADSLRPPSAEAPRPEPDPTLLRIETPSPEAVVYVDGEAVGTAADVEFEVAVGLRRVALVDGAAWDARRVEAGVEVVAHETTRVTLVLPVRTRVESLPLGAEAVLVSADGREEVLGTTPLTVDRAGGLQGRVVVRADGFEAAEAPAPPDGGRVSLVLSPELTRGAAPEPYVLPTARRNTARVAVDYALVASTLAAGALAVHYKFQADAADEAYRAEGSSFRGVPAKRDEALRFDRLSGIALGASSASLGVLALRFALR